MNNLKFKIVPVIVLIATAIVALLWFNGLPKKAGIVAEVPQAKVGQALTIPVFIDTHGYTINAAEVYLNFDPSQLEIKDISKENSFFKLWITNEPNFSNEKGELSLAGGLPSPGFKGRGVVGSVTLIPKQPGRYQLTFNQKTRILINDGQGTAVPLQNEPIRIYVK